jgi:hypothetical protein
VLPGAAAPLAPTPLAKPLVNCETRCLRTMQKKTKSKKYTIINQTIEIISDVKPLKEY